MAELVQDYHSNLQLEGLAYPADSPKYTQKLQAALQEIPAAQQLQDTPPDWGMSMLQVQKAIHSAKNG